MFAIDDPSASPVQPVPEAQGTPGYFNEGNPGLTPPTLVRASWLNSIQGELLSILNAAAIAPVKTTYNQVLTALQSMFGRVASPNSWSAAQQGAFVSVPPVATGATLILNFSQGNNFVVGAGPNATLAIAGSFVLGTPANVVPGQSGIITFVQNGVGGFSITGRSTQWIGANGARPNLTAGPNGRDSFYYYVDFDGKIVISAGNNVS